MSEMLPHSEPNDETVPLSRLEYSVLRLEEIEKMLEQIDKEERIALALCMNGDIPVFSMKEPIEIYALKRSHYETEKKKLERTINVEIFGKNVLKRFSRKHALSRMGQTERM